MNYDEELERETWKGAYFKAKLEDERAYKFSSLNKKEKVVAIIVNIAVFILPMIILSILKLCHVIDWAWYWILLPLELFIFVIVVAILIEIQYGCEY